MADPDKLVLARRQLAKAQTAAIETDEAEVDWLDLALYSFYALENAVAAAADHFGVVWKATHVSKVEAASALHEQHGLPDVSDLLQELNTLRKGEAYGEPTPSMHWSAEDIVTIVEEYVDQVERVREAG